MKAMQSGTLTWTDHQEALCSVDVFVGQTETHRFEGPGIFPTKLSSLGARIRCPVNSLGGPRLSVDARAGDPPLRESNRESWNHDIVVPAQDREGNCGS